MDYLDCVSDISFRFIKPHTPLSAGFARFIQLLAYVGIPLEIINTKISYDGKSIKRNLRKVCKLPKMSTFAIGVIINRAVAQMAEYEVFVNIGVWHGFTFLSGMVNNQGKMCIGIDNFSEFGSPKKAFIEKFNKYKSPNHFFYEMDYITYFKNVHKRPIGVYVYDGNHNYENQLKALQVAEPFFSERCIILVDDINYPEVREATLAFIHNSFYRYQILFDMTTACNYHPTFWNGIIVFQRANR
jgi:hypothetical protein